MTANAVEDAYMRFEQSMIRDYIPLLVERRAHKDLARLASDPDLSIELARMASDPDLTMEMARLASDPDLTIEMAPTA